MKRRGFLKFLAAVPIAIAVKPSKKKKYVHRAPKKKGLTRREMRMRDELIERVYKRALEEVMMEEDRKLFAMMRRAA